MSDAWLMPGAAVCVRIDSTATVSVPPCLLDMRCLLPVACWRCTVALLLIPCLPVSAAPHMGSAYPTIAADAVSRYQRLRGRPVTFITGTDEHGEKIALAAANRGLEPQAHCDDIVSSYKALWRDVRRHGSGSCTIALGQPGRAAAGGTLAASCSCRRYGTL